jgi:hypothetical protein
MASLSASSTRWLVPGCRLDRYDLLLPIAEGGMALLWVARQEGKHAFDKIVALKTISPKFASDRGFQEMFLDEAHVVSKLAHPNVAQVLDLGEDRGVLFLVMEWIDGESLINVHRAATRSPDERIPLGILLRVMVDACAGLHAAHELTGDDGKPQDIVHRDVSPHNLLVGFRGITKVIDFGIAKASNRIAHDTQIGVLKGRIPYMAPEQALGLTVDRRVDIWSAGATAYRFLAGRVPYNAADPIAVLRRIADGEEPGELPETIPEPVRRVVGRAVARRPEDRFQTADEMRAALEHAMGEADVYTTHEQVALFMAEHLGEARAIRARDIDYAVRESRARMRAQPAVRDAASVGGLASSDVVSGSRVRSAERSEEAPGASASTDFDARSASTPGGGVASIQENDNRPTVPVPPPSTPSFARLAMVHAADEALTGVNAPGSLLASGTPLTHVDRETRPLAQTGSIPILLSKRIGSVARAVRWVLAACGMAVLLTAVFTWRLTPPQQATAPAGAQTAPRSTELTDHGTTAAPPPSAALAPVEVQSPEPLAPPPANEGHVSPNVHTDTVTPERASPPDVLERARSARRAGRLQEAAALFAAAVAREPTNSEALTGLGEVEQARGATAQAIADYRAVLALNPRYLPAHLGLADCLWRSADRSEAQGRYRKIVQEFPATLLPDRVRERASAAP